MKMGFGAPTCRPRFPEGGAAGPITSALPDLCGSWTWQKKHVLPEGLRQFSLDAHYP